MLHRPQSIFLVITIIVLCLAVFMSIWGPQESEPNLKLGKAYHLDGYPFKECSHGGPVSIISLPLALPVKFLSLIAVFIAIYGLCRYDNRVFQIKLGLFNNYVLVILFGLSVYLSIQQRQKDIQLLVNCLLPAISLASNLLANRYIRRDEKLVKAADRLR
jgi:hypothetical protein